MTRGSNDPDDYCEFSDALAESEELRHSGAVMLTSDVVRAIEELGSFFRRDPGCGYRRLATLDALNSSEDEIKAWFLAFGLPDNYVDVLRISDLAGIILPLDVFIRNYEMQWFPSRDDVVVVDQLGEFILELDHEEQFSVWKSDI